MTPQDTSALGRHHRIAEALNTTSDALEWRLGVQYSTLECGNCGQNVGRVWRTQPAEPELAYAGKVMLDKAALHPLYVVGSGRSFDCSSESAPNGGTGSAAEHQHNPTLVESVMTMLLAQREELQAQSEQLHAQNQRIDELQQQMYAYASGQAALAESSPPPLPPTPTRQTPQTATTTATVTAPTTARAASHKSPAAKRKVAPTSSRSSASAAAAPTAHLPPRPTKSPLKLPSPIYRPPPGVVYSTSPLQFLPLSSSSSGSASASASGAAPRRGAAAPRTTTTSSSGVNRSELYFEAEEHDLEDESPSEEEEEEEEGQMSHRNKRTKIASNGKRR